MAKVVVLQEVWAGRSMKARQVEEWQVGVGESSSRSLAKEEEGGESLEKDHSSAGDWMKGVRDSMKLMCRVGATGCGKVMDGNRG